MAEQSEILEMTADIVSAYVGHHSLPASDLPALLQTVHKALAGIGSPTATEPAAPQAPAVSIRKSIQPDFLVCLEDGRRFKSLKRHLQTRYGLSPQDYRAKWGLPKDYPMVAPNYAAARSALAKASGLGVGGRQAAKAKARGKK